MSIQKKILFIVLSTLIIASRATQDEIVNQDQIAMEDNVLILTDENFDRAVKQHDYILIEFYAPWCGHCKELAPEYSKAAAILAKNDPMVHLAKIDGTQNKIMTDRFKVDGFPKFVYFQHQERNEYRGGRTEQEIVSWLINKTKPNTVEILMEEQLEKLKQESQILVTLFQKQTSQPELDLFNKVAQEYDDMHFAYTTNKVLFDKYSNGQDNRIVMFRQFDERQVEFKSQLIEENLRDFIAAYEFPTIMNFNQKAAEKIFGSNKDTSALILLHRANETKSEKALDLLREVSQHVKPFLLLAETTIEEELGQRLAEYIGITDKDLPAFRILTSSGDDIKKYIYEHEFTAENLKRFVKDFTEDLLKPLYKSEDIPEKNDKPVKVVVGHNWDTIVNDKTKDVLVEFYAPWCGHCKKLTPIYNKLAETLSSNPNIVIAKIDGTLNDIEGVNVQGFPTIRFYPSNNKEGLEYDGERTKKAFLKYLEKQTTFEWSTTKIIEDL